jgi:hypothetical protein
MKAGTMSDDNILEIKDFKKIDGEVVQVSGKKKKSKSKKPVKKNTNEPTPEELEIMFYAEELTLEEQFAIILEENEYLRTELVREHSRSETLEKLLNKVLKENKNKKDV